MGSELEGQIFRDCGDFLLSCLPDVGTRSQFDALARQGHS